MHTDSGRDLARIVRLVASRASREGRTSDAGFRLDAAVNATPTT